LTGFIKQRVESVVTTYRSEWPSRLGGNDVRATWEDDVEEEEEGG
jgi:hypothetical protein